MKYKVGDKVRIKSKEWYESNRKEEGFYDVKGLLFMDEMAKYCGKVSTIIYANEIDGTYRLDIEDHCYFNDGMLEDVESDNNELIIKSLNKEKEYDLPIDTPCICSHFKNDWILKYYSGDGKVFQLNFLRKGHLEYPYIIPFDRFDPNNILESIKYNIVDKIK